jgi:outer membrane protein OmpA-like peptidoglycan-associated protein
VKLLLRGSSATFSDMSLPLPFKTYIHDLEGSVLGISTTKDVTTFVKLRGGVDQYGQAKIDGALNTKNPKNMTDLKVTFENLELKGYTPYSLEFLGYKIAGGKLFLDLGYKIDQGKLNGANRVVIKQIEVGEEKVGGSPWPLRLVVALLEDSDGIIDIDLPIEGDVNSPDFKYGKVVWQVIGNLFTKAVTSPFRLLGSMMGIESDKLSSIDFEAGSATLTPPQIEKLDRVTSMLAKRPKLMLNVFGSYDETADTYALKETKLVQLALKRNKNLKIDSVQALSVDMLESIAVESLDKKELSELKTAYEEKYPEESAYVRHYSAALVEKLVPLQPLSSVELQLLAQQRGESIRNYLIKSGLDKRVDMKGSEVTKDAKKDAIPVKLEIVTP